MCHANGRELCISFTIFSVSLKLTYKQHLFLYTNIERGRKKSVPVAAVLRVTAIHISRKHHSYKIHVGGLSWSFASLQYFSNLSGFFLRTRMTFSGINLCLPCVTFHWLIRSYFTGVLKERKAGLDQWPTFCKRGRKHTPPLVERASWTPLQMRRDWRWSSDREIWLASPALAFSLYSRPLPTSELRDGVGTTVWLRWQSWCCKHLNQEPIQTGRESAGNMGIVLKVSVATFLNTEEGFAFIWRNATVSSLLEWEPEKIKTSVDYSENVGI